MAVNPRERGILVAIEGIDGAGKTTQVKRLRDALVAAGEDPVTSKEPTSGPWGQKIKQSAANGRMSLEDELAAFINDRTEHVQTLIQPALEQGRIVILDRYYYSTIAYQGSRGADIRELKAEMEKRFPIPDAVFVLDIEPSLGLYRISHLRTETPNEFERLEPLKKARQVFLDLASDPNVQVIDGSLPESQVHSEIVRRFLDGPLKARGQQTLSRRLAP